MLAVEILVEIEKWLPLIAGIIVLAFDWGILYAKLKDKPNTEKVSEMIDSRINLHYGHISEEFESLRSNFNTTITDHKNGLDISQKNVAELRDILMEVKLNLKSICEQLNIKYISINNGKG